MAASVQGRCVGASHLCCPTGWRPARDGGGETQIDAAPALAEAQEAQALTSQPDSVTYIGLTYVITSINTRENKHGTGTAARQAGRIGRAETQSTTQGATH